MDIFVMGVRNMIFSKLFKQYYPLRSIQDLFMMDKADRDTLADWMRKFDMEIESHGERLCEKGYGKLLINKIPDKDFNKLKGKLAAHDTLSELEAEIVVQFLNAVMQRNKYRAIITFFVCPAYKRM